MRLVSSADEEFYEAVCLATKLGRADRLLGPLEQKYEEDWEDPQACLRYGLACMATLDAGTTDTANHGRYNSALTALNDAVMEAPDLWLARYCRARLRALVPTEYDVYQIFAAPEWTKAGEELNELIVDQEAEPWRPYFAATHLLAAFVASRGDDPAAARAYIASAGARPPAWVRMRALGAVFCEPFVAVYERAGDDRPAVAALMKAMFPDQPAVVQALAQPVR